MSYEQEQGQISVMMLDFCRGKTMLRDSDSASRYGNHPSFLSLSSKSIPCFAICVTSHIHLEAMWRRWLRVDCVSIFHSQRFDATTARTVEFQNENDGTWVDEFGATREDKRRCQCVTKYGIETLIPGVLRHT
jgi:hypothetical protein